MLRKECKNISDVLFAHYASICFIAAIEIPLHIFSGKASIYFGNLYLAFKVAITQLFAQQRKKKCLGNAFQVSSHLVAPSLPSRRNLWGLGEC